LVIPAAVVLAAGLAAIAYYNYRVTGNALEMPWVTHYNQYCVFPLFIWQDVTAERTWNHEALRAWHAELELSFQSRHHTLAGLVDATARKLARFWIFFIGPVFTLPLLLLPWVLRNRWMVYLTATCGLLIASSLMTFGALPHYLAPVTALAIAVIVQCLRHVRTLRYHGRRVGRRLARLLLAAAAAGTVVGLVLSTIDLLEGRASRRNVTQRELEQRPGRHLVIVRYGPNQSTGDEWVFNEADIDAAKIVWARETDADGTRRLLHYFADRKAWLMEVGFDTNLPQPVPYPN